MSSLSWFSRRLLPWYDANRRHLPWRRTTDPYRIWLSEVILQQTRVDQGLAYYERFVARFPTIQDLARAREREVLKLWQGLGYYSRARNLLKAAGKIREAHHGRFPRAHSALKELPGVGPYTAAAIASIAFGEPKAVVDGNVYRVLARVFGIATPIDSTEGRKEFQDLAERLIDPARPGDHNQAVMELGATVCRPIAPACGNCPLRTKCVALRTASVALLPVKAGRNRVRERWFNYLDVVVGHRLHLRERKGGDIWQGLYEPPLIESRRALGPSALLSAIRKEFGPGAWKITGTPTVQRHLLSHQIIHIRFWSVSPPRSFKPPREWRRIKLDEAHHYPVPRPIEEHLRTVSPVKPPGKRVQSRPRQKKG